MFHTLLVDQGELLNAARAVRERAYAPYSGYRVGAAVLGGGAIYSGCNVENVSYPVGLCAERAAIAQMVAAGCTRIEAVAVVTKDGGVPCGMCLQALLEFAEDPSRVTIHCADENNLDRKYALADLFPFGFRSTSVGANVAPGRASE